MNQRKVKEILKICSRQQTQFRVEDDQTLLFALLMDDGRSYRALARVPFLPLLRGHRATENQSGRDMRVSRKEPYCLSSCSS